MSIRVAIVGPTGYTGLYLIQLLLRHPSAEITYLASHRQELPHIADAFPSLLGRVPDEAAVCKPIDPDAIARAADVAFLCLPHRAAMQYVPPLLDAGVRVIDLSADYRLTDPALYQRVYEHPHTDLENLKEAVYGLPELYRDHLPGAMLVANPGCYPTAAALGIAPLLARSLVKPSGILISAASGTTGAGRTPAPHLHFPEHNESFMAYGTIGGHRHQSEIQQTLSDVVGHGVDLLFVPHLLPIDRGILETIFLEPSAADVSQEELFEAFEDAYEDEPFVRVRKDLPNVKNVRDTNFCDITVRLVNGAAAGDEAGEAATTGTTPTAEEIASRGKPRVVVFSAIDNMIKGASGQAIQNMNLIFEQEETLGLL